MDIRLWIWRKDMHSQQKDLKAAGSDSFVLRVLDHPLLHRLVSF
jgi:hypothetical protein